MESLSLDEEPDLSISYAVCANNGDHDGGEPCQGKAASICGSCKFVQYCGKACQKLHWPVHKNLCKSDIQTGSWMPRWMMEGKQPNLTFDTKRRFFWGNMPAIDMGKLHQDECRSTDEPFRFLFAASGDLRNVIKSVVGLPLTLTRPVEIFINDIDEAVVVRDVIVLLIAMAIEDDSCVETMIHVWYSALLPEKMLQKVRKHLLPLFEKGCAAPNDRAPNSTNGKSWFHSDHVRVEWTFPRGKVALTLPRKAWKRLHLYLKPPTSLTAQDARKARLTAIMHPDMSDSMDLWICRLPPKWRSSYTEFRIEGILLPYSYPRRDFDTPNPTLFVGKSHWPKIEPCDPLWGWSMKEVLPFAKPAPNDIYGGLYAYLKELFRSFIQRLTKLNIRFECHSKDAGHENLESIIVDYVDPWDGFDRIETSNLVDPDYLGPRKTLSSFGWLLRSHYENPHATIVTLNMQFTGLLPAFLQPSPDEARVKGRQVTRLLSTQCSDSAQSSIFVNRLREQAALKLATNNDKIFKMWMRGLEQSGCLKDLPVKMRSENRLVKRWPMRLEKDATADDLDQLCCSGNRGCEWYVEWQRTAESGAALKIKLFSASGIEFKLQG